MSYTAPFGDGGGRPHSTEKAQRRPQTGASSLLPNGEQSQPNAGPIPLPQGLDLSALAGISTDQVALIARLLQSGALPNPLSAAQPNASSPPNGTVLVPTAHGHVQQHSNVNTDKEDGELEEGELDSDTQMRDALPQDHRSSHISVQEPDMFYGQSNGAVPPHTSLVQPLQNTSLQPSQNARTASKRDAAKAFVAQLHMSGYRFNDIARHVNDRRLLVRLYKELKLPSPDLQNTDGQAIAPPAQVHRQGNVKPAVDKVKRAAAIPAAPVVDRSEYLAKLAAARAKPKAPAPVPQQTAAASATQQTQETPKTKPALSKVSYKTELVKQRLEALKAERAALRAATAGAASSSPMGAASGNNAAAAVQSATAASPVAESPNRQVDRAAQSDTHRPSLNLRSVSTSVLPQAVPVQPAASPVPAAPGRPFQLPGLFVTFSTGHQSSPPAARSDALSPANTESNVPSRQRPIPDSDQVSSGEERVFKRSFGQSGQRSPEQVVIQVSEDEDDPEEPSTTAEIVGQSRGVDSSALGKSTSGAATPKANADYLRTMEQLEELKRQLAERERSKAIVREGRAQNQAAHQPGQSTPSTPMTAQTQPATASRQQQRFQLQQRLLELEEELYKPVEASMAAETDHLDASTLDGAGDTRLPTSSSNAAASRGDANTADVGVTTDNVAIPDHEAGDYDGEVHEMQGVDDQGSFMSPGNSREESDFYSPGGQCLPIPSEQALPNRDSAVPREADGESDSTAMSVDSGSISDSSSEVEPNQVSVANAIEQSQVGEVRVDYSRPAGVDVEKPTSVKEEDSQDEDDDGASDDMSIEDEESDDLDGDDDDGHARASEASHSTSDDMSVDGNNFHNGNGDGQDGTEVGDTSADDNDAVADDVDVESPELDDQHYAQEAQRVSTANDTAPALVDASAMSETHEATQGAGDADFDDAEYEPEISAAADKSNNDEKLKPKNIFTPYRSPLMQFKDYKYHPEYLNTVPGGYKSLTYNHQIDPDNTMCPYEATGGRCNDRQCQHQHFSAFPLSDDDLLKSLVSRAIHTNDPEQSKRWRQGLGALIQRLRASGQPQDASTVAACIVRFRRDFVGDHTMTINLF